MTERPSASRSPPRPPSSSSRASDSNRSTSHRFLTKRFPDGNMRHFPTPSQVTADAALDRSTPMRLFSVRMAAGLILAAAALPHAAMAQGYGVYEQGACVMGRAGTGVASACADGSSIFFNPAGITAAGRQQVSIGGTLIAPRGDFTNDLT